MSKLAVLNKARSWIGRRMTWNTWDNGNSSTFYKYVRAVADPDTYAARPNRGWPSGLAFAGDGGPLPAPGWKLSCFEMPLMAALACSSRDAAQCVEILQRPEANLPSGSVRRVGQPGRIYGSWNPGEGDLVFWKLKQKANKYLRAFGEPDDNNRVTAGLDHVALGAGGSQVISFWGNLANGSAVAEVERASIATLTERMENEFKGEFDVTYTSPPW